MEQIDVAIIGAGVVGLAIASEVAKDGREVYVFEKNSSFGRETSERNSEVIHAGIYYPKDSLQARLCTEGRQLIYEISRQYGVPTKKLGKIIVAIDDSEISKLENVFRTAQENGVPNLSMLDKKEIQGLEPNITATAGILSPETGILSAHDLMKYFISRTEKKAGVAPIVYRSNVINIERVNDGYIVSALDPEGNIYSFHAKVVVNSAGLNSDKIAEKAGIDIDKANYRLHYCKGEYFRVSNKHNGKVQRLVYPVPVDGGLGVHVTLDMQGDIKLGPNVVWIPDNRVDYNIDPSHQQEFFESAKRFLPFLEYDDLHPDQVGIRPKLSGKGMSKRDFVIQEESARGLPGLINLIGIESPGLTSSPAIGKYVGKMVDDIL